MRKLLVSVSATGALIVGAGAAYAQDCSEGPKCASVSARAQDYLSTLSSTSGINDSATQAYCMNMVAAEVASFCASELRQMGNADCANLAEQQAEENKRVAGEALGTAAATASSSSWHAKCGWN